MTAPRLQGVRVLVTRPRERAEALCFLLEDEGAEVLSLPLLELLPPADPRPLRSAAEHVQRYAWIAFASPSAVQALVEAVREAGTWAQLGRARLAAVGPQTAKAIRGYGLEVAREAATRTGAGLHEAIRDALHPGDDVLLPAAEEGRAELADALAAQGVAVTRVCAYRAERAPVPAEALEALRARPPQVLLFASPRTVEAFLDGLGEEGRALAAGARRVAIGPTTAAALAQHALPPAAVAEHPTAEGLVEAAITAVALG